ncbi:hypothetical protein Q8F55_008396 [Vanrija albida]|uniref:Uncharacterized protein n=1 Tax=Vanrija albida TaxID=181172 RepID=A0ABR3PW79_9TREE
MALPPPLPPRRQSSAPSSPPSVPPGRPTEQRPVVTTGSDRAGIQDALEHSNERPTVISFRRTPRDPDQPMTLHEATNEAALNSMFAVAKPKPPRVRAPPPKPVPKPAHLSSPPESPDARPSVASLAQRFGSSSGELAPPPASMRSKVTGVRYTTAHANPVPVPRATSPVTGPPRVDPTAFPHIFDAIFARALSADDERDHATALALRAVCRGFRDRADAYLYAHVIFDDPDRPAGVLDEDVVPHEVAVAVATRLEIRSVHGRLPAVPFYDATGDDMTRWLACMGKHTTIVDYHCAVDAAAVAPDLAAALEGKLAHCRRIWPSVSVLPASTIVDYIDITSDGFWTATHDEEDDDYDPIPVIPPVPESPHIHLNVINVVYSVRMGYYSIRYKVGERKGLHLAFTFTQRADSCTRSDRTRIPISFSTCHVMNGPQPFGFLGPLFMHLPNIIRDNRATALIGLEDVPEILMGMKGVGETFFNTHIVAQGMVMCCPMEYVMGENRYDYADPETAAKNWIGIGGIPGGREVAGTKWAVMSNQVMRGQAGDKVVAFESAAGATRVAGKVARLWFPLRDEHTMDPPGATCDAFGRFGGETIMCMIAYSKALMPDDLPAIGRMFHALANRGSGGSDCVVQQGVPPQ